MSKRCGFSLFLGAFPGSSSMHLINHELARSNPLDESLRRKSRKRSDVSASEARSRRLDLKSGRRTGFRRTVFHRDSTRAYSASDNAVSKSFCRPIRVEHTVAAFPFLLPTWLQKDSETASHVYVCERAARRRSTANLRITSSPEMLPCYTVRQFEDLTVFPSSSFARGRRASRRRAAPMSYTAK